VQQLKVTFQSGALNLEGLLLLPPETASGPVPGVVFCHPHPLYGGSMHNNVLFAAGRTLAGSGMAVLLFNFRGVGLSEGTYDGGRGEIDDARAAIAFLGAHDAIDRQRLGLAGYSFGAVVALAAGMEDSSVKAVVAVSPPELPQLSGPKPCLVVWGSKDAVVPAKVMQEVERIAGGAASVEIVAGADHFWIGFEEKLAGLIVNFYLSAFYGR